MKRVRPQYPIIGAQKELQTKVALMGGGKRAAILLNLFWELEDVEVVAIADKDPSAPGMALASEREIPTFERCRELGTTGVDIIIDTTGKADIQQCLRECKPADTEVIGAQSAWLIWRLLEDSKRGRKNAQFVKELSEAYAKINERESEIQKSRSDMELTNKKLEKHLAEMFFIHEFFKALTSYSPSATDVAGLIADGVNGILGVELSCVYELKDGNRLDLLGFQGRTREQFKENIAVGEGLIGRCAEQRNLVNKEDPGDKGPLDSFMANGEPLKTQAAVPLIVNDKLLGVLGIGQTMNRQFTERELSRTESIGHMSSLAMQNAIFKSELERLSVTDRLTELYNHGHFQQRLEEELSAAKRHDTQVSLLLLDIDYFKQFNDTFGHPKGDKVLKRVAAILRAEARREDTVARYGGEEFVVVVPGTDKEGACELAERIRAAVEAEPFEGNEDQPEVTKTVSIGVAAFPQDAETQADLIDTADKALYRAKDSGRNRVIPA